jgi:hypothetical protein
MAESMIPKGGFLDYSQVEAWYKQYADLPGNQIARIISGRTVQRNIPLLGDLFRTVTARAPWRFNITKQTFRATITARWGNRNRLDLTVENQSYIGLHAFQATFAATSHARASAGSSHSVSQPAFQLADAARYIAITSANQRNHRFSLHSTISILNIKIDASRSNWQAFTADARMLEAGATPAEMAAFPLWPADPPYKPAFDRKTFLAAAPSFEVWLDWYEPIVDGKAPWGLPRDLADSIEMRIALGDSRGEGGKEFWERDADEVNPEIKVWVDTARAAASMHQPVDDVIEPPAGPGPQFAVIEGKLAAIGNAPQNSELASQRNLHQRLAKQSADFAAECQRISNRHPSLANAASEYALLLSTEIETLDVTGVWSVGGSLAGFATAFLEQNAKRTLTEPLEPHLAAQLQSIVRQHGAFILGFEEGRDLVNRADEFLIDRTRLEEIAQPGNRLIDELSSNRDLVEETTIAIIKPTRDVVHELGWLAGRNGHTAYLIVRNSVRSIIKFSVGEDRSLVTLYGGLAIGAEIVGMPVREFTLAAMPFVRDYAQTLLQFFAHSPEMHAYVQWAIKLIEDDSEQRKE